jgi:hypothetical protein
MAQEGIYRRIYDLQAKIEEDVISGDGHKKPLNGKNGKIAGSSLGHLAGQQLTQS